MALAFSARYEKKEALKTIVNITDYVIYLPFAPTQLEAIRELGKKELIYTLQADGHELEFIRERFTGIPIAYQITRWTGEMANFIASNLT